MSAEVLKNKLEQKFSGQITWEESKFITSAIVPAGILYEVVKYLYDEDELQFRFLTDLTAVHYPDRAGEELCVVYHLHALAPNQRLRLKVNMPVDAPHVRSIVGIFSGANWMERETYDFYGVIFEGHPNLTRILNVDEMDYHPMRKEYPMEDPTRMDKDDEMFGRGSY